MKVKSNSNFLKKFFFTLKSSCSKDSSIINQNWNRSEILVNPLKSFNHLFLVRDIAFDCMNISIFSKLYDELVHPLLSSCQTDDDDSFPCQLFDKICPKTRGSSRHHSHTALPLIHGLANELLWSQIQNKFI